MSFFWAQHTENTSSTPDASTGNFWETAKQSIQTDQPKEFSQFWDLSQPEIKGLPDEWLSPYFWTGEMIQNEGPGNTLVVVGQTAANQYTDTDLTSPLGILNADLSSLVDLTLDQLNNRTNPQQQVYTDLPGGANRLFLFGDVDLTT